MTHGAKQVIEYIKSVRDRETLSAIISAAESRDAHLSNLESDERKKRLWSKYSHIRKGDTVFVHAKPAGRNAALWGEALHVVAVQPRSKIIEVRYQRGKPAVKLTPFMLDSYKVSLDATAEAFHNALAGDTLGRKAAV